MMNCWEVKRLGDIGFFIRGVSYKKEQLLSTKNENSVYLLRANNIQNELNLDELQIIPKELVVDKIIQNNDILFAMSSGSKHIVGKNILLNNLNDFTFGAFCGLFRIINLNICHKFIAYYLRSDSYKNYIFNISKGSNINNLRFIDLEKFQIPLPPLQEQERIVGILDESFAKIDESIKILEQDLLNLDELMQSALQKAFNPLKDNAKENYKLPQGWEWKSLGDIGEIITGTTPSKNNPNFYGNEYPLFKPSDLNGDMVIKYASDNLSKVGFDNARNLPKNTILIVCIGASIGKVGLSGVNGSCNQQINAIIPSSTFVSKYLFFVCLSNYFQEILKKNASQTTLPIINKTEFSKLKIPLPPLQEQEQIASYLDRLSLNIKDLKQNYQMQIKNLQELKKSLLDKAFQGRL
ncbi:restriction endonuclease subunit S [Campylobacter lari]|nr:restriction endonuclease subunit S [Campylobacter lari]EAI1237078.1 restriction endonuclease subunit S [Campylobacter lari]EAK0799299.1 restriction endonuclease subunit S [Campylobacter lari]EAK0803266.1 restriction endonuclease subunit S [Campylobacter lari]EAK0958524.1 restriction endonuclease subunit S [Campylobacter lari]